VLDRHSELLAPGGHDWLEVTALSPEPPPLEEVVPEELPVLAELESPLPDELALPLPEELVLPLPEAVVVAWADLVCRARAGSCPVTKTTVISSQVATNSASAPATTRRRIMRTRAILAERIAVACEGDMGAAWARGVASA
jgi:hypothetical protein